MAMQLLDLKAHVEKTLAVAFDRSLFENNNPGIPLDALVDPHRRLEAIREKFGPVVLIEDGVLDGIDFAGSALGHYDRRKPAFLVLGYDAVMECMNDTAAFRQGHSGEPLFGDAPLFSDPPEQTPYKSLAMRGLGRSAIEKLDTAVIRPAAEILADRITAKGSGDLVPEYTGIVPVIALSALFDLPPEWSAKFIRQGRDIINIGHDMNAGFIALGEMRYYFTNLLYERRRAPGDDFISWLIDAKLPGGEPLRTSEIVGLCMMLVGAGAETTGTVLGQMMVGLLSERPKWEALCADRSLVPGAVAEALRWEGPAPIIPREARQDTTFRGFDVPQGAKMFCAVADANRDASRWACPHQMDINREAQHNLAFGSGAHVCAGHVLARTELETALDVLLERAPTLRLDPDAQAPQIRGFSTRSVGSIPYRT
jgi:cytochrome P450